LLQNTFVPWGCLIQRHLHFTTKFPLSFFFLPRKELKKTENRPSVRMHFSKIAFFTFVASVLAVDLLTVQDYADFQISDGVAGNALAEVAAKFPV